MAEKKLYVYIFYLLSNYIQKKCLTERSNTKVWYSPYACCIYIWYNIL